MFQYILAASQWYDIEQQRTLKIKKSAILFSSQAMCE